MPKLIVKHEPQVQAYLLEAIRHCKNNPDGRLLNKTETRVIAVRRGVELHEVDGSICKYVYDARQFLLEENGEVTLQPHTVVKCYSEGEPVPYSLHGLYFSNKDGTNSRPVLADEDVRPLVRSDEKYWSKLGYIRSLRDEIAKDYSCASVARLGEILADDVAEFNDMKERHRNERRRDETNRRYLFGDNHNENDDGNDDGNNGTLARTLFQDDSQALTATRRVGFQGLTNVRQADIVQEYMEMERQDTEVVMNIANSNRAGILANSNAVNGNNNAIAGNNIAIAGNNRAIDGNNMAMTSNNDIAAYLRERAAKRDRFIASVLGTPALPPTGQPLLANHPHNDGNNGQLLLADRPHNDNQENVLAENGRLLLSDRPDDNQENLLADRDNQENMAPVLATPGRKPKARRAVTEPSKPTRRSTRLREPKTPKNG